MTSSKLPPASAASRQDVRAVLGVGRPSGRRRRLIWALAAVSVVLGGGWLGSTYWSKYDAAADLQYTTAALRRGDLTVIVTATGTVQPTNQVNVSSELSGIVREVKVDFNDTVKAGDVLAELDTEKLEAQVAFARASLAASLANVKQAEATVAETKQEYERQKILVEKKYTSDQSMDAANASYLRAQAGLLSARANVDVAKANLSLAETDLRKACICSPIDGVVLTRSVDPGQTVASSLQAPVLFTIAEDLTKMQLEADVDEADVGRVAKGQKASFRVDSYPDQQFPAEISEVRYAAETVGGVVTYKAILSIDNTKLLLRPGMTATADITVQEVHDALLVPNTALRFSPLRAEPKSSPGFLSSLLPRRPSFQAPSQKEKAGPGRTAWVLRDGVPVSVPLSVGASDGAWSEVLSSGLEAGDAVIVDAAPRRG